MIFKHIKLVNFRQYKGEHFFDFTDGKDGKNITLIIAANGVGKTTFLQAFRYCFYGSSSNYLKLPRVDELINNSLVHEMEQLDDTMLSVEVAFTHKGIEYVAKRSQKYYKKNKKMVRSKDEDFIVMFSTANEGYKTLDKASSEKKIWQILPPGLSHIFMFDGERIEKRIETNEYKKELKESILGILDLKKIDFLIQLIGSPSKSRSLLGLLNHKISHTTMEERRLQKNHDQLQKSIEETREKIELIMEQLEEKKKKKKLYREKQKEIEQYQKEVQRLTLVESELESIKKELISEGNMYLLQSGKAILNKLLIAHKKQYDGFIKKSENHNRFFQYLHIDTLKEILDRKECLCGTRVEEGTNEYEKIQELFTTALPIESAHYLNKISDTFKRVVLYKDQFEELNQIRVKISDLKRQRREKDNEKELLEQKIRFKSEEIGDDSQINIQLLDNEINKLNIELGEAKRTLETNERLFRKLDNRLVSVLSKNERNKKIRQTIDDITEIKEILKAQQQLKDEQARKVLSKLYNTNFSTVINGDYKVDIDDRYNLTIYDNEAQKDVTEVMSTGQSVIITLSFIKSLIETAKTISRQIDEAEQYGVIMDAALSNVDESHINNLCKYNLNALEQLIFLSFKRQLRNEMFNGIKDHIGKAYYLEKNNNNITTKEIELNALEEFIHQVEE
jgi:DNA sulfur modification protein DndD